MLRLALIMGVIALTSCHRNWHYIPSTFDQVEAPASPDYSRDDCWASRPDIRDAADTVPSSQFQDKQALAEADVFYIHPTTFLAKDENWNAAVEDRGINHFTQIAPVRHQGSMFNGCCKVYAPRYRQAHIKSYLHEPEGGTRALQLAYSDVLAAFDYYMEHFNDGRPFVLAGHSQGATHGVQLIKDRIDGTELQERMIIAYLVGMPVKLDEFEQIPPCGAADDLGCFLSWMTFGKGYEPWFYEESYRDNAIHNPLTYSLQDEEYNSYDIHKGIVVKDYKIKYVNTISAKPEKGLLYIKRPNVPVIKWFVSNKIWHEADINLFWVNLRENLQLRVNDFLENQPPQASQSR